MTTNAPAEWNIISSLVYNVKNYAKFGGRASRAQYWWFYLAYVLIYMITCGLGAIALLVPMIAASFRRVQDAGKPGWFCIIPIYGLILCLMPSTPANQYGEGPEVPPAA